MGFILRPGTLKGERRMISACPRSWPLLPSTRTTCSFSITWGILVSPPIAIPHVVSLQVIMPTRNRPPSTSSSPTRSKATPPIARSSSPPKDSSRTRSIAVTFPTTRRGIAFHGRVTLNSSLIVSSEIPCAIPSNARGSRVCWIAFAMMPGPCSGRRDARTRRLSTNTSLLFARLSSVWKKWPRPRRQREWTFPS